MVLDFSENADVKYSLKCINSSTQNWTFYIYQRMAEQSNNGIYSLVWMISPYKVGPSAFITFVWSLDYSFFWFDTGSLQQGIVPLMGGSISATLNSNNSTTFNITNNTPGFSIPTAGSPSNQFLIMGGNSIPNSTFSTGIGISNSATFLMQTYVNTPQTFNANQSIYVAATTTQIQVTETLNQNTINNTTMVTFPINTYNLTATLGEDNLWTIS
jgi:rhizosphere induced protein